MNDAASVLIIVLSVVLVVFLLISIVLIIYLIKIAKQVKATAQHVNNLSETTKGLVSGLVSVASPAFFKAFASGIAKKVKGLFDDSKKDQSKNNKPEEGEKTNGKKK